MPDSSLGRGALGFARGVADLGDTLINAGTYYPRQHIPALEQWNTDRQNALAAIDEDHAGMAYDVGRLGGRIGATWPVGGLLVRGALAVPGVAWAAEALPGIAPVLRAVESGGASGAPMTARMTGGALSSAAGASLVEPESVGSSALIGGLAPRVIGKKRIGGEHEGSALEGLRTWLEQASQSGLLAPDDTRPASRGLLAY